MGLLAGTRIGSYEILSPLGAGGMGEVYRARDTRLEREVALKVLPEHLGQNVEARSRFEREARAIAALTHPNILAIHDFGVEKGIAYSVTELLEGETLRGRMGGAPLPARKAVDYALQIAHGLAAAHDKGIVHRDLKPENVFVTKDGRVKILDFGLAKAAVPAAAAPGIGGAMTQSPTLDPGTQPGTVMGTTGYMSPEQVRGASVDTRSDIFAFGVIFYEMLAGVRAFRGDTAADTMSAILREDPPDLSQTGRPFPPALERIVRHCMEKSPEERFQSARDIAFALEALTDLSGATQQATVAASVPAPSRRRPRWLAIAGVAVLATIALAGAYFAGKASGRPDAGRTVTFQQLTFRPQTIFQAESSPDGKTFVFSAALKGNTPDLFSIDADYPEPRPLGLTGVHLLAVSSRGEMALLTHARWVAHRIFRGTLARMPLGGGAPREMIEGVRQADWSPKGDDLAIIRDVAGKDQLEYPIGKVLYEVAGYLSDPRFSPAGDRIAFFEHPNKYDDRGSVNVVDLSGNVTMLSDGYWGLEGLVWTREGDEVLFSAGTGYSSWQIYGVSPLSRKVRPALQSAGGITIHDITPSGRWIVTRDAIQRWTHGKAPGEERERDLSWTELSEPKALTPDGRTLLFTESGVASGVNYAVCLRKTDGSPVVRLGEGGAEDLSPDGKWALSVIPSTPPQAILYPTGPGEPRKLERGPLEQYQSGAWFPDGRRVLFGASEPGRAQRCYEQEADGGPPRPVTPEGTQQCRPAPDGRRVLAKSADGTWSFYPIAGGPPEPIAGIEADENVSRIGRDGRSIIVAQEASVPARVTRLSLDGGARTILRDIAPEDLTGVLSIASFITNDDETAYAYCHLRYTTELFLVDGAR